MSDNKTDWTDYYKDKSFMSSLTRTSTENILLSFMSSLKYSCFEKLGKHASVCELGGANSCFIDKIKSKLKNPLYTVIDNNEYGLSLFMEKYSVGRSASCINQDLSKENISYSTLENSNNDIVFSVGLIEHFNENETNIVIANHFKYLETGGICIITFPTPTLIYRVLRKILESIGQWKFHDERALDVKDVVEQMNKYGLIVHESINYKCLLSQGVVVAIKR